MEYAEEAETCRRKALAYVGQPEATFLLRVAKEFDRLERRIQAPSRILPRRTDRPRRSG